MLPKSIKFVLIVLVFSTMQATGARRKSKVDTPIALAADAPLSDNIATASGSEPQVVAVARDPAAGVATDRPAPIPSTIAAASPSSSASVPAAAPADEEEECDSDMVGFEIITGYAHHNHHNNLKSMT